ncbi:TPA: hypothetical protein ACH3X1_008737 [Trebouxia sp. C0004]
MGKKKQRKGAPDLDDDAFPEPSEASATVDTDTPVLPAAALKKPDKKKKAKKGKAKDAGWGSDDEAAGVLAAEVDKDTQAEPVAKKPVRKQAASAFDLLQGSDEEAEQPSKAATSFSALDDSGNSPAENGEATGEDSDAETDEADSKADEQAGLVVAEVFSVNAHPKSDRLRVCSVDYGHDVAQVVTNAAEVAAGMKVIFAGIGITVPGSGITISKTAVRGVDSFGMLCSAHDIGWSDKAEGILVVMPDESQPGDACPADPPKGLVKASKKGKAGKSAGFSADLDDPELETEAEAEAAPSKQKGKKKQRGRKAAMGGATLEDEDVEPAESILRTESVPDEEELASVAESSTRKAKKGKKEQAETGSAFAALGVDDDDIEAESHAESAHDLDEADEAQLAAPKGKSRKGKKKQFDAASAFAALGVVDDNNEETAAAFEPPVGIEEAVDEPEAAPNAKSKKGKKKQIDTASAFAALRLDDDENEQTAEAAEPSDVAVADAENAQVSAPPRKSKKGKRGAVDAASAFAALGLEDDAAPADGANDASRGAPAVADEEEEVFGKSKSKKKSKKKTADLNSVFAALDQNGHAENGDTGAADTQPEAFANGVHVNDDDEDAAAFGKNRKKSSKSKRDGKAETADAELDALLEEIGDASPEVAAAQETAPAEETSPQPASKSKKKKKGKAAEDTEDIDALLAELDGPAAPKSDTASAAAAQSEAAAAVQSEAAAAAVEPATEASKGKKKKKKGKGGAKDEEDLDAVLAELGMAPAAKPEAERTTDAQAQPSGAEAAGDFAAETAAAAAENDEDPAADGDGKEMTAAEKKKAKKKAREKAKKAGGDADDTAAPAGSSVKKGGKKVSAAVRKMQEEVEARQKAEAEAARLAEEQRIREEEEERQREEDERQKKEDTERRKAERLERRAQLKREGKLLTGKAKKEAERLAAVREQFLKQSGMETPAVEGEEPAVKKKVVYGKKKAQPKPKPEEADARLASASSGAAAAAETQAAAEANIAAAQAQAEEAKAQAQQAEEEQKQDGAETVQEAKESSQESEDDWETNCEDIDAVPAIGPAAAQAKQKVIEGDAKRALEGGVEAPAAKKPDTLSAQPTKAPGKEEAQSEDEEDSESEEESDSDDESEEGSDEESSSEYSSSEGDSDEEAERRLQAAKEQRQARLQAAMAAGSKEVLRSPICCILGHVDTGKTKILDNVRRTNVQDGEAGGITQQIGATYVPEDALLKRTQALRKSGEESNLKLPGLLIIDTPGHESFSNLRSRGSSLCDIAILVVDMMHGLEQQTIESINLLKMRKTPFVVALNKIDRLFDWKAQTDAPIQQTLNSQKDHVKREFDERLKQSVLNLNEQGLNVALYWQNPDKRKYVNVVPTSAITGEGLPDMLQLLVDLTQSMMASRLMVISETQCTVLEVKVIEGLGTTIDVVLVNGLLHEGDTIVLCGMGGPIVTQIRSLLTPHPLKELRVRGSYLHHKEIKAAQGVKIAAQNLESAVAGTQMLVAGPNDDVEVLKAEVMEDMKDIFGSVDRSGHHTAAILMLHHWTVLSKVEISVVCKRQCCNFQNSHMHPAVYL